MVLTSNGGLEFNYSCMATWILLKISTYSGVELFALLFQAVVLTSNGGLEFNYSCMATWIPYIRQHIINVIIFKIS